MTKKTRIVVTIIVLVICAIPLSIVFVDCYVSAQRAMERLEIVTKPAAMQPIMSTPQFNILAVGKTKEVDAAISSAENAARIVEREMNIFNPASELSKFNAAAPNETAPLSPETIAAILAAKQAYDETGGAFDATLRPVILLWKNAAKTNKLPTEAELSAARKSSSWSDFQFDGSKITKTKQTACVDLGGIAKGYAIDLATNALKKAGCEGGLVDIGGDICCFGHKKDGSEWIIGVRDPFDPHSGKMLATLKLTDAGVCTSGNYERAELIQGKRYNHIVDPRTCQPADACPSVTVIAPSATQADAWATALSVLGPDGLTLLPKDGSIHAMLVVGDRDNFKIITSPHFSKFVTRWETPQK